MIIVVGIGQTLRGDDEAGLAAVRLWMETHNLTEPKSGLEVVLAESPGINLLNLLAGADKAILVDAVQSDARPGTIHVSTEADLSVFSNSAGSAHGWGVAETLALGRKIDPKSLPGEIIILGIEIQQLEVGSGLSPAVASALPEAVCLIQKTIERLSDG